MEKIKFAIVGCGNIGKRHIAVIDAEKNAELVAICDTNEEVCKELSRLYNDLPYYTDYSKMLDEVDFKIINICTPHFLHADMTVEAAQKGKHILCEKPLSINMEDGKRMIKAAEENKVELFVVKQNRYNIPIELTKRALDKGHLGKIFKVQCDVLWNRYQGYYDDSDWRGRLDKEGGALYTQVSHFIDLLIWLFGEFENIQAKIETQNHNIEVEDDGSAIFNFSKGGMGSINWTTNVHNQNYEGSITIIAENGTIKIGGKYLNKIEFWDVTGFPLQEGIDFSDQPNAYGKYQGTSSNHDKVIADIVRSFSHERNISVSGLEGLKSIKAIEDIYKACR